MGFTNGYRSKHYKYRSEHQVWRNMKVRCYSDKSPWYEHYKAKGIKICPRWTKFENFLADMGPKPSPEYELDRKNGSLGYNPNNCRWATKREQHQNTTQNRNFTIDGETKCMAEWARIYGVPPGLVNKRVNRSGWSIVDALTQPSQQGSRSLRGSGKC